MAEDGLFDEVAGASSERGLSSTARQAIGYKEAAAALAGEISREEAVEEIKRESRRYAKRQLTWLRRNAGRALDSLGRRAGFRSRRCGIRQPSSPLTV